MIVCLDQREAPLLPSPQVAVISVATAALVYRYAVDPRHLEHHPSLHGGTAGLHRPGSGMGSSAAVAAPAGADVEGQRAAQRSAAPLTWQQVRDRLPPSARTMVAACSCMLACPPSCHACSTPPAAAGACSLLRRSCATCAACWASDPSRSSCCKVGRVSSSAMNDGRLHIRSTPGTCNCTGPDALLVWSIRYQCPVAIACSEQSLCMPLARCVLQASWAASLGWP